MPDDPITSLNTPPPSDPLASIKPSTEMQLDPDAQNRRASLYGFANYLDNPLPDGDIEDSYLATHAMSNEIISQLGETQLRQQATLKSMEGTLNTLSTWSPDIPGGVEASQDALRATLQQRAMERQSAEAEKAWAENVALLKDNNQTGLADLNVLQHDQPDLFSSMVNRQASRAQLMRAVEDAQIDIEQRGWFFQLVDNLMYMVPFSNAWANTDNFQTEITNWYDNIFSGQRKQAEANSFWKAIDSAHSSDDKRAIMDQFIQGARNNTNFMFGQNQVMFLNNISALNGYVDPIATNVLDAVDNVPLLGGLSYKAFKLPFRLTNTLRAFKANETLANTVLKAKNLIETEGPQAAAKKMGIHVDEVEDVIADGRINPKSVTSTDEDIAGDLALQKLDEGEQAFKELIGDVITTQRLSDEELLAAEADMNKRAGQLLVRNPKDSRFVTGNKLVPVEFETGQLLYSYEAIVGAVKKAGQSVWFKTQESANIAMSKMGIKDAEVLPMEGGFGIKIRLPFDETGNALGGARHYTGFEDKMKGGAWAGVSKFLAGGKVNASEDLFGLAGIAVDKRNKIMAAINQNVLPKFYKLNKNELDYLGAVMTQGEKDAIWYNDLELKVQYAANFGNKANPEKFIDAYRMTEKVSDMDFRLRNLQELINLHVQGYEGIQFGWLKTPVNGKVLRGTETIPNEVVFKFDSDGANGRFLVDSLDPASKIKKGPYAPRLTLPELAAAQAGEDAYTMVRLQKAIDVEIAGAKAKVRYFLVPGKKFTTHKLSAIQVPYRAGGHRMYAGKYFPKKAVTGKQPWGEAYLDRPFTPTVSLTRADAQRWVDEANELQTLYKNLDETAVGDDEIIQQMQDAIDLKSKGFPTAEEFVDWMKKYGADHPFEVCYDREFPSHYGKSGSMGTSDLDELSGTNSFLETQGKMFLSGKGDILRDINDFDGPAPTIDPFKTLNASLTHIARMTSLSDFKIRGVQKWNSSYAHALDLRGISSLHPMRIFLESKFKTGTRELQLLKAVAEQQRDYIKRILGWKSDFDLAVEASGRHITEFVAGANPGYWNKTVHATADWWAETRPINSMMGLAFDSTMGLFNIGQFPLQAQTSLAALSIDVTKGTKAMSNMLPIMHIMRKASIVEKDLDFWIERGAHKIAGFDNPADYKLMMTTLKKSGWMDNMMSVMKNDYGPKSAMGVIGRGVNDVRKAGRFFIDKAEEWNRGVAWQIAWKRVAENPAWAALKPGTPRFVEKVRDLASTFAANMDEAGAAWWQKNLVTKLPTQFLAYMARWLELAMPLNKSLTWKDRFRFLVGQGFMYGAAGLPVVATLASMKERSDGKAADIKTFGGMLQRGFWDTAIYLSTGADVAFSARAGIGNYPTDIVNELFGMSKYGEVSTMDITLGPTYQIFSDMKDALSQVFMYSMAETGGQYGKPMTEHALTYLARHISTLNNFLKADAIWQYGQYTNRKGEVIMKDMPSIYGFAALLGVPPGEFNNMSAQIGWEQDRKKRVDGWAEQVVIQRQQLANAIQDGDTAKADEISQAVNFMMGTLIDPDLRKDVLDKANKDSRMDGVVAKVNDRVTKEQTRKQFIEENAN